MDGARLVLATGATTAQTPINRPDGHFLAPEFVETWAREIMVDSFFASIMTGAAASLGKLVDRTGTPLQASKKSPKGGAFLIRCGLLYRRGQGEADRLCIPKGGGSAGAGPARVPRRPTQRPLRTLEDVVASSAPGLLGGARPRRGGVRSVVPDVPAH